MKSRSLILGLRTMRRRPLVSASSVVCLAVGMGACAAAWTLIDAVILRPYGLADSRRLAVIWEADTPRNQPLIEVSYLNFLDWQREARTVEAMAAFGSQHWPALARFGSEMVPLTTRGVSSEFFPLLGTRPMLGRNFGPSDATPGVPPPLMLSHRLWLTRFGGQPSIVGQKVFVDGADHSIIGVMPAGFAYPDDPDAWISVERVLGEAFQNMPVDQQRRVGVLEVLAKRTPSASNADVQAELTGIVQGLQRRHAASSAAPTVTAAVTPFADLVIGRLGQRLWIAFGMSAAVLLLACANAAAARSAHLRERGPEINARLFLGATRDRIVRELAVEGIPLALCGAAGSVVVWLLLVALLSTSTSISDSGVVLRDRWSLAALSIVGTAVLGWLLVAVLPAVAASRPSISWERQGASRVASRTSRVGAPLLFAQSALAIVVLVLAGAALLTFQRLSRIDLGFATRGVTLVDFSLPSWKYASQAEQRAVVERLQEALRQTASVARVAAVSLRPFRFGEIADGLPVRRTGDSLVQPDEATSASRVAITPEYFEALGQRLEQGRAFSALDQETTEPVVIISRTLAHALFGDRPAVGERLDTFTLSEKWRSRLIVGVAGDAQYRGLERPSLEVYVPIPQARTSVGSLVIASAAPFTETSLRQVLRGVEPDVAIEGFQTTADLRQSVLSPARLLATIVALLGAAGLLLLALGIFATAAAALRAAWAEIAVRQAIGARPWQAARAPLRVLTRALMSGVAGGLALAPAALLGAAALGLSTSDALVLPLAGATVLVIAAAAIAIIPSWRRAATLPPAQLLRESAG